MDRSNHQDIRIGTLASLGGAADYLKQILPHGFESFELTAWAHLGDIDLAETAKAALDVCGGHAIISSIGIYGNPLQDDETVRGWERLIDSADEFGCNVVCGFAGAVEDKPVDQNMERFREVWLPLSQRAEDNGVRIAFENCDMGGTWDAPKWNIAHSPRAWNMMFETVPSDALGLEWEPCHQMVSLIDPIANLREWVGKIYHVHGKDATIQWDLIKKDGLRSGLPCVYHRTPGFGDTNWTDVITLLRIGGFQGAIDIEGWHDPVYRGELEMTGQVHGMNYLKACRGSSYVPNPVTP